MDREMPGTMTGQAAVAAEVAEAACFADDLTAASGGGCLWMAWSESGLDREGIVLGRLEGGKITRQAARDGFRPALALLDGAPVLAFCCRRGPRRKPALLLAGDDEPRLLPASGDVHRVLLSTWRRGAHVVWTEGAGEQAEVVLGRIDRRGGYHQVQRMAGREPALASVEDDTRLALVDAHGLRAGRVCASGVEDLCLVSRGAGAGAPALDRDASGRWWVAWHAPVGEGVLRWLWVAQESEDGWSPAGPAVLETPLTSGEDQGWENPALLADGGGRVWLAGRSSGGFHVQAFASSGWTPRLDVSRPGWSGRSLTCSLVEHRGGILFARGTPAGVCVSELSVEQAGEERASAQREAPATRPGVAPAARRRGPPDGWPRILFGDIHQHSLHSDGTGSAEEAYRRARDLHGHDLVALTDHEQLGPRALGPVTWQYMRQLADAFHEPGRFVTLPAYEFTGARLPGPGHKCVYFGERVPDRLPPREREALEEVLREYGAIAVPHHVGWTGADMARHDPKLQPVWEICSVHGAYEHAGKQVITPRQDVVLEGQFIRDALDAGLVFGLVGGTDSHGLRWHHGVARVVDPARTGLAALFAEPTRKGVLDALRARRCYATSGARILLEVDVEGAPMGAELQHHGPELFVRVHGTAPVKRLSIVQDGREVRAASGGPRLSLRHRVVVEGARSYCYARALQEDGEMAWSSPVWISR